MVFGSSSRQGEMGMAILECAAGVALILLIFSDAFEALLLPRTVTRLLRPARLFYRSTWVCWRRLAALLPVGRRRELFLGTYGPLSLLALFVCWGAGLILGFALVHWSLGTAVKTQEPETDFGTYLYLSGVTLTTLGYGDVIPTGPVGRFLVVVQAGFGFGFLALVIGYLPVLYQAFSRREASISLMDARAGSPPSAAQLLLRVAQAPDPNATLAPFLAEWERWAAELLESHLSFPVLAFYRSQHDNESWLATLTVILDTCALLLVAVKGADRYRAQLTFAVARHAAVDLALIFRTPPCPLAVNRLPPERWAVLREQMQQAGLEVRDGPEMEARLTELRGMYELFVSGLADYFLLRLPPVLPEKSAPDNWQTSAWMRRAPGFGNLPGAAPDDDHFD
jgi:Ion channel